MALTAIGFGAWAIGGGGWQFGWGPQDDDESVDAMREALDSGINWIDTAAIYGLGHSEEVVGRALKAAKQAGHKPYVFTKCSMKWDENREIYRSLKTVRQECEDSLRRLGVETIDLYQVHWPQPEEDLEEGWQTMADLQREGKIRWLGASNFTVAQLERVMKIAPVTSLQPPYSMIRKDVEAEVLPFCAKHGIGVINYAPMQSGLLTGKMSAERVANMPDDDFRKKAKEFNEPRLSRNLDLVALLSEIGEPHGVEPGVVAIAWTLHHPAITAAIVGGRSAQQVKGILPAMTFRLSEDEYSRVQQFIAERP